MYDKLMIVEQDKLMTPQEKWDRLNKPTCLADYGLSMSREEMLQVPEAHVIVEIIDEMSEDHDKFNETLEALGEAIAKTIDSIFVSVVNS